MGIFSPDGALARLLNTLGNLIVLNILTIICCVPVFTAGAAMTALYTMVMRMVRKEDGKIIYIFAVQARFDNTMKNTAKNALLFCVGKLPQAVLMLLLTLIPAVLLTISYRFVSVDFLIGLSGPAYLAAIYFADLFKNYEDVEEETVK